MDLVETEGKWLIVIQFLWGGGSVFALCIQGALVTAGKAVQMQVK